MSGGAREVLLADPGGAVARWLRPVRSTLLPPALAVLVAAVICAATLLIAGANPVRALGVMISQVGRGTTAVDIVNNGAVYYLAAVAVAIGFQMNLFNIGVEGQYRIGAVMGAVVGGITHLPPVLHALLILATAAASGAAWAGIVAVLKVTRGVSEVISSIMLNAIAGGVIAIMIRPDTFGVLDGNNIATPVIDESGWVPGLSLGESGTIFGLVLLAVALGAGYWLMLRRTRYGFELQVTGESITAATAGGVRAKRTIMVTLLLSGAIAGLVAMPEILGRDHSYALTFPAGYGFSGLAIALLGRNHPGGIAFGALLWAFLDRSAVALDNIGVPREIVTIMQGTIVLAVVVAYEVVRRLEAVAEQRRVGEQLAASAPLPQGDRG